MAKEHDMDIFFNTFISSLSTIKEIDITSSAKAVAQVLSEYDFSKLEEEPNN